MTRVANVKKTSAVRGPRVMPWCNARIENPAAFVGRRVFCKGSCKVLLRIDSNVTGSGHDFVLRTEPRLEPVASVLLRLLCLVDRGTHSEEFVRDTRVHASLDRNACLPERLLEHRTVVA